jgi:hypothetical protein
VHHQSLLTQIKCHFLQIHGHTLQGHCANLQTQRVSILNKLDTSSDVAFAASDQLLLVQCRTIRHKPLYLSRNHRGGVPNSLAGNAETAQMFLRVVLDFAVSGGDPLEDSKRVLDGALQFD